MELNMLFAGQLTSYQIPDPTKEQYRLVVAYQLTEDRFGKMVKQENNQNLFMDYAIYLINNV
jgi:hypothetical protein